MTDHRFRIGQKVGLTGDVYPAASGDYEIIALLPPDLAGEFQYRVRSDQEKHERVTPESRLLARN